MFKMFLIKYAEIAIKGKNRYLFEDALVEQIRHTLERVEGHFVVTKESGRVYVSCKSDFDFDEVVAALKTVFGIVGICPVVHIEDRGFDNLAEQVVKYVKTQYPEQNQSFKVFTRRVNKRYPMESMEVSASLGERILDALPGFSVDVHHPQIELHVEIRKTIYIYSETIPGPGGMPLGTNGQMCIRDRYKNVLEELRKDPPDDTDDPIRDDYDLVAYSKFRIDFEYIMELLQGFVDSLNQKDDDFDEVEFERRFLRLKALIKEYCADNPKLSDLLMQVLNEIKQDKARFLGQDVSVLVNQMRYAAIDKEIKEFADKWFIPFEDVKYEVFNFKDGELANENKLKEQADYAAYKEQIPGALPKFKFNGALIREFKEVLMPEIELWIEQ